MKHATQTCLVNGEETAFGEGTTVADLLRALDLTGRKVAVEKNGAIVSKSRHAEELVRDGDNLEIITAVGGG